MVEALSVSELAVDPRTPPTKKGQNARQRLLDAGRDVIGAAGYGAARVVDITSKAGLSQGAFYRYFKDRHELLVVLLEEMLAEAFAEARAPWDARRPSESVRLTTIRYFDFYQRNRGLMRTMVETAQSDPIVRDIWNRSRTAFYQRFSRALVKGVQSGTIRDDLDLEVAAELLGSMSEFYAFQRFALNDHDLKPAEPADVANVLTEIWSKGVEKR